MVQIVRIANPILSAPGLQIRKSGGLMKKS